MQIVTMLETLSYRCAEAHQMIGSLAQRRADARPGCDKALGLLGDPLRRVDIFPFATAKDLGTRRRRGVAARNNPIIAEGQPQEGAARNPRQQTARPARPGIAGPDPALGFARAPSSRGCGGSRPSGDDPYMRGNVLGRYDCIGSGASNFLQDFPGRHVSWRRGILAPPSTLSRGLRRLPSRLPTLRRYTGSSSWSARLSRNLQAPAPDP
jgi:hypothetical protein